MKKYQKIVEEWKNKKISSVTDLDQALENYRILFAFHSNKIENPAITYHDTREIFEHGRVSNYTGDLRTLYEIENQKICYEFLREKILDKEPLSKELILKIHKLLMRGCYDEKRYAKGERPGTWKKNMYVVGDETGVEPEEVEQEIQFILDEVNQPGISQPLTAAAYLHLNFESIHPHADGNGRVGRTLMNYYLMLHDHPPLIIYEEDRSAYYMALALFDKTDEIEGFVRFLKEETEKTWNFKKAKRIPLSSCQ